MKRLWMLTVLTVLTAATVGCGLFDRCRRGSHCDTCPSPGTYGPGPTVSAGAPAETYLPAPG